MNIPLIVTSVFLLRLNFAIKQLMKMMTDDMEFPEELYRDEAVCFIVGRYHVSPHEVIRLFQEQNNTAIGSDKLSGWRCHFYSNISLTCFQYFKNLIP